VTRPVISILLISSLLLIGCAKDGVAGKTFMFWNDWTFDTEIQSFTTTVPQYDEYIWDEGYEPIATGTFTYICTLYVLEGDSTIVFTGSFQIDANPGKPASGFQGGLDGKNRYYDLHVDDDGVSVELTWEGSYPDHLIEW